LQYRIVWEHIEPHIDTRAAEHAGRLFVVMTDQTILLGDIDIRVLQAESRQTDLSTSRLRAGNFAIRALDPPLCGTTDRICNSICMN